MTISARTLAALFVTVLLALLAAGCGSAPAGSSGGSSQDSPSSSPSPEPSAASTVGGCAKDSAEVTGARTIAKADLDGDGTAEPVRLTTAGGQCPSTVFVATGDGFWSAPAPSGEPPVTSAYAVTVPELGRDLLVTTQKHPRGGFQLRVLGGGGGRLTEVQADGQPLVPFIATDVQEHPLSIDCASKSLVVTEAVAHEPAGVVFAYDVRRTTYALEVGADGVAATKGAGREVADNVLSKKLSSAYPALVQHRMFTGCRAAG